MRFVRWVCWAQPCLLFLFATYMHACQVPVFRYALERWQPDPYEAIIVHRGTLTEKQKQLAAQLQDIQYDEKAPLNLVTSILDLDKATKEELGKLHGHYPDDQLPKLVVNYPFYYPVKRSAWEGKLSAENVKAVIDSPVRKQIVKRLLDGESAIWILIECGNKEKDEAAAKLIAEQLKINQKELKLPEQETLENDEFFREETTIKLRLAFSMISVSRQDAAEGIFLQTLLNSEKDLPTDEPIAIPVFGRGRSYYALVGKGINEKNMGEDCRFLTGPCSCRVKVENPGVDLLFAVDWDRKVSSSAFREVELPELAGISNAVAAAAGDNVGKTEDGLTPVLPTTAPIAPPPSTINRRDDDPATGAKKDPADEIEKPSSPPPNHSDDAAGKDDGKQLALAPADSEAPEGKATAAADVSIPTPSQSSPDDASRAVVESAGIALWIPILGVVILGMIVVGIGSTMLKRRPE